MGKANILDKAIGKMEKVKAAVFLAISSL